MTDHYTLLGVERSAQPDAIQQAFRRAAAIYHPDRPTGDVAKMQALNAAYQVLMDREKRAAYDSTLTGAPGSMVLACVSADDYEKAKEYALANAVQPCAFCDGAREVRVGGGGFWYRKPCPVCAEGS